MSDLKTVCLSVFSKGGSRAGGGKPKAPKWDSLLKTYQKNCNGKHIATVGFFNKLPLKIAQKIQYPKLCSALTPQDNIQTAKLILSYRGKVGIHITDTGLELLNDIIADRSLTRSQKKAFNLRHVFITQERQLCKVTKP